MRFRSLALLALLFGAFFLSGCLDSDVDEQTVPWGRPADWERGAPGFGGY